MPTGRGTAVAATGLLLWIVARITGSPGMDVVGAGLVILPLVAWWWVARWPRPTSVRRRTSASRVGPDEAVRITVEVRTEGHRGSRPGLVATDTLPASLGGPVRMPVALGGDGSGVATFEIPPRGRGRYRLGPLALEARDPFSLARKRSAFEQTSELVVTPRIEELTTTPTGRGGGATVASGSAGRSIRLLRGSEEFSGIRGYQEGDDLRGIHWPSVARTGELMIRQGEPAGRSRRLVFIDNRVVSLGAAGTPVFERAISAAASIGLLLLRDGGRVSLATATAAPIELDRTPFLDALTDLTHDRARALGLALGRLRTAVSTETSLVFITGPPERGEVAALIRACAGFGNKLIVLVRPAGSPEVDARVSGAMAALTRAGWDRIVLDPSTTLEEGWRRPPGRRPIARTG